MDEWVLDVLEKTYADIERGAWTLGREKNSNGDRCLIGWVAHHAGLGRGSSARLYPVWEAMGLRGPGDAVSLNDQEGRQAVLELIEEALDASGYLKLHRALDESRIAHAQRDLGKNVPAVVPEAWEEAMEQEQVLQVTT